MLETPVAPEETKEVDNQSDKSPVIEENNQTLPVSEPVVLEEEKQPEETTAPINAFSFMNMATAVPEPTIGEETPPIKNT